jgi:hypothetical protein
MTYVGAYIGRRIAGTANSISAFESTGFPEHPLYSGRSQWFLPIIGNYLRLRDKLDRKLG